MKTFGIMCMVAAVGCSAPQGQDGAWVDAGAALRDRGVYAYRVETTSDPQTQAVALRGAGSEVIGRVQLGQSEGTSTVSLTLRATTWQQVIIAAAGQMTITLDGQTATLKWNGSAWTGDASGQAIFAQSQSFIELVQLIGGAANLQPTAPASAQANTTPDAGSVVKPDGGGAAPTLACSDVVTTGSGWAWYWEEKAEAMACRRATDAVTAACQLSSGYDCCNVPKDCVACVNWGTGWACSTDGYLQYASYGK